MLSRARCKNVSVVRTMCNSECPGIEERATAAHVSAGGVTLPHSLNARLPHLRPIITRSLMPPLIAEHSSTHKPPGRSEDPCAACS